MASLQVDNVSIAFAGLKAVDGVGFAVQPGSITSLIGPNGAGKTTLINIVTGVLKPDTGSIRFEDKDIAGHSSLRLARSGMRRTFQAVRLFAGLTVRENIAIGQHASVTRGNFLRTLLPMRLGNKRFVEESDRLLEMFGLTDKADLVASELSYGNQRRVEIVRALAGQPRLLLLDEPAAGMNEPETQQLRGDIERIRQQGITVFLIEHDMALVMAVSDRIVALDFGKKIAEGTPAEIKAHPDVISSYLGT
jgi:branched-chain amino acid transport system ATP-binding protein